METRFGVVGHGFEFGGVLVGDGERKVSRCEDDLGEDHGEEAVVVGEGEDVGRLLDVLDHGDRGGGGGGGGGGRRRRGRRGGRGRGG